MARIMPQNHPMSIALRAASGAWSSRTTFMLGLTTAAVGLGNLWRFSYLVGENGGALFLLVYLATLFMVAVPVMIAEVVIGSHGRANPVSSVLAACERAKLPRVWSVMGWLMALTAILILANYAVVGGWTLAYIQKFDGGLFSAASAQAVAAVFSSHLADPEPMVYWQSLFILLTFTISALGIHRGLAVLFWLAVPLLLVLLGVLIIYSLEYGAMEKAGQFLFSSVSYDFDSGSVLTAMGHAFFTLGVGVGVGIAFGAYAPEKLPIGRTVMAVAVLDTFIAIAAGIAIFPIVFANNLEPAMGPGLMFVSLPYAFGNMPQGETYGLLFFLLVAVVAVGSAVALAEPPMSWLKERLRLRRPFAALLLGGVVWLLAWASCLSFNQQQHAHWLGELTLFQSLDVITVEWLLPLGALLVTLFAGYALPRHITRLELYRESNDFYFLWRACLRYIAPPVILFIMLAAYIGNL
ncbi:sodium-dependent transporter [Halieaceae bacterium IMCC14734]|uniref:Sodium-dependent transporter n=2 Tax=Candidatus Litorirhabdus singularis TaxID=2518993 RepID=A0ABT3TLT0_9GAMM|nr:sodium-dependent transporter [Candidatus Litorirhabdus singularis]